MKKIITILLFSFITLPAIAIMTPGEPLKSPGEVIQEIKNFKNSVDKKESSGLRQVNDPEGYRDDMTKAQKLTTDALFAYLICDLDSVKRLNLENYYQDWGRDPLRYAQFEGSSPENRRKEYVKSLKEEKLKLFLDCKKCKDYKPELLEFIKTNMPSGRQLESPGEIIHEIKNFKYLVDKKERFGLRQINDPEGYLDDMGEAQKLTKDALFAYFVCDLPMEERINLVTHFKNQLKNITSKDPKKETKEGLEEKMRQLLLDCEEKAEKYKPELLQHIKDLEGFVMYRKLHEKDTLK